MRGGQSTLTVERLMDVGRGRTIADRPSCGFHVCNDVGGIVLAGLGHMHFIPHPRRRMLFAVPGLDIIRRTDKQPRRWNTFFSPSATARTRTLNRSIKDWHTALAEMPPQLGLVVT